jgi:hypothetical protein
MNRRVTMSILRKVILYAALVLVSACTSADLYKDQKMDFGSIYTVAVMPLTNLSRDQAASERVRDVFETMLLASGDVYVVPQGEVARGVSLAGVINPSAPSNDEIKKLGTILKADAIITGVVREYGEVRSGSATANVLSLSFQMAEVQTGKVVWSVSSTKGGIGFLDRLFGGGGEPMNDITEKTIKDVINNLFK